MKQATTLAFAFVKSIPESLEERTLYVSMDYATAAHKCGCGCGGEVVTPLSPTDWKLIYDGETVSLSPSIGNWSFACRSHYWIDRNVVNWAGQWSEEQVEAGRMRDHRAKRRYYTPGETGARSPGLAGAEAEAGQHGFWAWLRTCLRR